MLGEARFGGLLQRLGETYPTASEFTALIAAFGEPLRHYHTAAHIEDCLLQFDVVRGEATRPDEIEAALWFHDVVYDPRASDNEERSADWAKRVLRRVGAAAPVVETVTKLVLLTRHREPPATRDGALLLDIDLSILGREAEAFRQYDEQIRQEYVWVPEDRYRAARAEILESFLLRPFIYQTDSFRERYEAKARENLASTIAGLRSN